MFNISNIFNLYWVGNLNKIFYIFLKLNSLILINLHILMINNLSYFQFLRILSQILKI